MRIKIQVAYILLFVAFTTSATGREVVIGSDAIGRTDVSQISGLTGWIFVTDIYFEPDTSKKTRLSDYLQPGQILRAISPDVQDFMVVSGYLCTDSSEVVELHTFDDFRRVAVVGEVVRLKLLVACVSGTLDGPDEPQDLEITANKVTDDRFKAWKELRAAKLDRVRQTFASELRSCNSAVRATDLLSVYGGAL